MVSKQQYWAIKNNLTAAEKDLIAFYELQWALRHHVPTVEEVTEHLRKSRPNLRQTSVNYYLMRKPVITALDSRGIPWRQHTTQELTDQQVAAALTVMNFADVRPIPEKLDQLGINPTQYQAWLNDPTFKNLIDGLSDQNLKNIKPTAITEFTKLINMGDWQAIKYYLDATGTVNNNDAPQSEVMLKMIIEVIQKHVKDPETMMAIARDLMQVTTNRTLEVVDPHKEITGEYTAHDPELEHAKKQLGFG